MATSTYQCPNCRAPITFKPDRQMFICDYCGSQFTPAEMEEHFRKQEAKDNARAQAELQKEAAAKAKAASSGAAEAGPAEQAEAQVHEYHCQNCGANVVTDETTTSTFCYYCHSPVIITTRLQGDFRPDRLLPFEISEETAKKTFLDWAKKKKYIPSDFTSNAQLEKMTGMYLPYWFMDSDVRVDFSGTSTENRSWRQGDYEYTETSSYAHERHGYFHLHDVNIPAFSKIDQNLLNGVEPFDAEKFVPFSMPMLSGFFTEQYTLSEADAKPQIEGEVERIAGFMLEDSLGGRTVSATQNELVPENHDLQYSLVPVWVLTYNYNGKIYVYALNGQTGRAFGEVPLVKKKLDADALIRGLITGGVFAVAAYVIMYFLRFGL